MPSPFPGMDPYLEGYLWSDVPLDLTEALTAIYDEAAYDLSVDYTQSPPLPSLSAEEAVWIKELVEKDTKDD